MGADIHIYAERRLKNGDWAMCKSYDSQSASVFTHKPKTDNQFNALFYRARSRNYRFFAALAGVRGDGPDYKGFPGDASPLVQEEFERWSSDAHSPSFYTAREFVPIFMEHWLDDEERTKLVADKLEGYSFSVVAHVLDHYLGVDVPYGDNDEPDVDAIRFVFWFDN